MKPEDVLKRIDAILDGYVDSEFNETRALVKIAAEVSKWRRSEPKPQPPALEYSYGGTFKELGGVE